MIPLIISLFKVIQMIFILFTTSLAVQSNSSTTSFAISPVYTSAEYNISTALVAIDTSRAAMDTVISTYYFKQKTLLLHSFVGLQNIACAASISAIFETEIRAKEVINLWSLELPNSSFNSTTTPLQLQGIGLFVPYACPDKIYLLNSISVEGNIITVNVTKDDELLISAKSLLKHYSLDGHGDDIHAKEDEADDDEHHDEKEEGEQEDPILSWGNPVSGNETVPGQSTEYQTLISLAIHDFKRTVAWGSSNEVRVLSVDIFTPINDDGSDSDNYDTSSKHFKRDLKSGWDRFWSTISRGFSAIYDFSNDHALQRVQ